MNDSLKKFLGQALKARKAADDSHDDQTRRQWSLVADMWDLMVHEQKRNPETAPDDVVSCHGEPVRK